MILIVDDETFAISLIERKLKAYNKPLITTTSVQSAIQLIETTPAINIVITDLHMPTSNGFELLEWLFDNKPHIKTIVTTAHSMDALEIEKSTRMMCNKILIKPFSVEEELIPAIEELLNAR